MSVAADGWTEANHNFHEVKMETNLTLSTKKCLYLLVGAFLAARDSKNIMGHR
jgi:hypothetical protein